MTVAAADPMAVFSDAEWRRDLVLVVRATQVASRGFAADALLLHSLARRVPEPVGTGEGALPWQSFVREIAVARGVSDAVAEREIRHAVRLVSCMPCTLELLACGTLTIGRAEAFIDELCQVDPDTAHAVDRAIGEKVPLLAPAGVRQAARRAIDRYDADAAAARAAKASARRGVRLTAGREGQAEASVTGPALPLTRWFAALTEAARSCQTAGDPRGVDQLRFDLLMAGFTAPGDLTPPAATPTSLPPATPLGRPRLPAAGSAPAQPAPAQPAPAQPGSAESAGAEQVTGGTGVQTPADADALLALAHVEAGRIVAAAAEQALEVLAAAHAAEARAVLAQGVARAEADRLAAQSLAERLALTQALPTDRRRRRPVQILVHVPITTALGLSNEPGWVDGYGWMSAPECRQLLPVAELRQVCTTERGVVVDLAPRAVRPEPTPEGAREALLAMATEPFDLTDVAWRREGQHDPSPALAEFVAVRDQFCDGPSGLLWPAASSDLDHEQAYPAGPTAAWNMVARSRRSHRLKHAGWTPIRGADTTMWISPSGQVLLLPRPVRAEFELVTDAVLVDPAELHALETELTRVPDAEDEPPIPPPF